MGVTVNLEEKHPINLNIDGQADIHEEPGWQLKKWQKGQSGNPSGRPAMPEAIKKKLKDLTPDAVDTVEQIMKDPKARPADRLKAAEMILDRVYGKATQPIDMSGEITHLHADITDDELTKLYNYVMENRKRRQTQEMKEGEDYEVH
jgi:hypothetical protein